MNIRQMHYDFKKKFNKVDSQQNRNMLVPEIDWVLNEASEIIVKMIAQPRLKNQFGFELNQRSIDDIRTIVRTREEVSIVDNVATLPADYWHFLRGRLKMAKGKCKREGVLYVQQHDDEFEESVLHKSSFEWEHVNGLFNENGIKVFTDGTFTNEMLYLSYLRKLNYIHNAQDFRGGSYAIPGGATLTGSLNSELPDHLHREIVDLAVLIATGETNSPEYQVRKDKLNFNNLN